MNDLSDALDRAIVAALELDGRLPSIEIARRVGVSEKTVRTRIARLMERQGLRVIATLDGSMRNTRMLFFIHAEAGRRFDVASRLRELKNTDHVYLTTGAFDIVVQASFGSDADALEFLVREIEGADGVRFAQSGHLIKELDEAAAEGRDTVVSPMKRAEPVLDFHRFVIEASRARTAGDLLAVACDAVLRATGADRALLAVFGWVAPRGDNSHVRTAGREDHGQRLFAPVKYARGLSADYVAAAVSSISSAFPSGLTVRVVETGLHVVVEDAQTDPLFEHIRGHVQAEGFRSVLCLPMLQSQTVMGSITIYFDAVHVPTDDQITVAQALADQVASQLARIQPVTQLSDNDGG